MPIFLVYYCSYYGKFIRVLENFILLAINLLIYLCPDKYAPSPFGFLVGDRVKISVDAETLEVIQSSDDKWDPNMVQVVHRIKM